MLLMSFIYNVSFCVLSVYTKNWNCWFIWQFFLLFWESKIFIRVGIYNSSTKSGWEFLLTTFLPIQIISNIFDIVIFTDVRIISHFILICICMIINNIDHFLMYLLIIVLTSSEQCLIFSLIFKYNFQYTFMLTEYWTGNEKYFFIFLTYLYVHISRFPISNILPIYKFCIHV